TRSRTARCSQSAERPGRRGAAAHRVVAGGSVSPRRSPGHADAVGDGVLVALAAARQILKNLLIVRALRDRLDFDREASLALASDAIVGLADEQEATADRLAERMHGTSGDRKRLLRRRAVVL